MTVARLLYTDLVGLTFTPSTSTFPTATATASIITRFYGYSYQALGETYAAYSASAEHAQIDTQAWKDILAGEVEEYVQALHDHNGTVPNTNGDRPKKPKSGLSQEAKDQLCWMKGATITALGWHDYVDEE